MGIPEDIALFEQHLNDLVIKYEQYFLGLEKREPLKLLDEVEKSARKYTNVNIVNTMLKFKYNSVVARFNSYKQYWTRINRLIEDGKYSRERFKMDMHRMKGHAKPPERESPVNPDIEKIYQQYMEARKACRLPVDNITPEMIATTLERQKPAIVNKYRCDKIEFKVVIEEGIPKIKARPKNQ
ncbi:MAG: hypothetical protein FD174_497 [Geobacteraceae bacterium]|nr:MAG: hypothetical protein FD174_497 [Geobacteraceae bacterium]